MFILTLFFVLITISVQAEVEYSIPLNGKEFQLGNRLEWITSYEIDTKFFIIEKSEDGLEYDIAGDVQAAGDSDEDKSYRFLDIGNNNEKTFYRLKVVNEDGGESISQTIIVKKLLSNNFLVQNMSNTHTNRTFNVFIDAQIEENLKYSLQDSKGETVLSTEMYLSIGPNNLQINLEDEPIGKYQLILQMNEEIEILHIRRVKSEKEKKQSVAVKASDGKKG